MAGFGSPELRLDGEGLSVAIVASSWHQQIMGALVEGAQKACADAGVASVEVVHVPGSFELPIVCAAAARRFDAVVALGVVIRGGTPHFDYVCEGVTQGLMRVGLDSGKPVGFGVLTCDDEAQAIDRSGLPGSRESKGYEAASAAIHTAATLTRLR